MAIPNAGVDLHFFAIHTSFTAIATLPEVVPIQHLIAIHYNDIFSFVGDFSQSLLQPQGTSLLFLH